VNVVFETSEVREEVKARADIIVQKSDSKIFCQTGSWRQLMDTWKSLKMEVMIQIAHALDWRRVGKHGRPRKTPWNIGQTRNTGTPEGTSGGKPHLFARRRAQGIIING
jgi:hypothetical protein